MSPSKGLGTSWGSYGQVNVTWCVNAVEISICFPRRLLKCRKSVSNLTREKSSSFGLSTGFSSSHFVRFLQDLTSLFSMDTTPYPEL